MSEYGLYLNKMFAIDTLRVSIVIIGIIVSLFLTVFYIILCLYFHKYYIINMIP